jgi:hypothetical protein
MGNKVGWLGELATTMEASSVSSNNIGARATQAVLDIG